MSGPFADRMAALDAVVAQCRGTGAFATGTVSDASNRSGRDWLWWGVRIERTVRDGDEHRRIAATVTLHQPAPGFPSRFEAEWQVRAWRGVGVDHLNRRGGWPLDWSDPSPRDLNDVLQALLDRASAAWDEAAG